MSSTENQRIKEEERRLGDFEAWIINFISHQQEKDKKVYPIEKAAELLNIWYWQRLYTDVHPFLQAKDVEATSTKEEKRAIRFKIISGIELAIISVQPFTSDEIENWMKSDDTKAEAIEAQRLLNAHFAYSTALAIFMNWNSERVDKAKFKSFGSEDSIKKFKQSHIEFLQKLDTTSVYPIFSNSETWQLFEAAYFFYAK